MANQKPSLRFDHREIAVVFSLFVFVSLLMFTVGILVGKGLSQAKYEGNMMLDRKLSQLGQAINQPAESTGTSVTSDKREAKIAEEHPASHPETDSILASAGDSLGNKPPAKTGSPLTLIPQKPKDADFTTGGLREPKNGSEVADVLRNPKLQPLLEPDPKTKRSPTALPSSFQAGKFVVQVAAYPTKKDAEERVDTLKKLGFPYAHFSAKEQEENKETWFRVWLGFYPDYDAANQAGQYLKDRGEVRQYLVRKSDSPG